MGSDNSVPGRGGGGEKVQNREAEGSIKSLCAGAEVDAFITTCQGLRQTRVPCSSVLQHRAEIASLEGEKREAVAEVSG